MQPEYLVRLPLGIGEGIDGTSTQAQFDYLDVPVNNAF
jgi:hypothetical protein